MEGCVPRPSDVFAHLTVSAPNSHVRAARTTWQLQSVEASAAPALENMAPKVVKYASNVGCDVQAECWGSPAAKRTTNGYRGSNRPPHSSQPTTNRARVQRRRNRRPDLDRDIVEQRAPVFRCRMPVQTDDRRVLEVRTSTVQKRRYVPDCEREDPTAAVSPPRKDRRDGRAALLCRRDFKRHPARTMACSEGAI